MCFDIRYNFCLKHFSFYEEWNKIWSKLYIGLHVKYPLFLSDFNRTWFFSKYFQKYSNINIHDNPSSGSQVVPCKQKDWQTWLCKLLLFTVFWTCLKMRWIIHSSIYPMSMFKELYHELLTIKNCVAKLLAQP